MQSNYRVNILRLSLPLAAMVIAVSCTGLFTHNFYSRETLNWQAQAMGQDIFDLFLCIPVLIATALLAYRGNQPAVLVWAGAVVYLMYTFMIYGFAVHFNALFLIYCFILGLSFYSLVYFFYSRLKQPFVAAFKKPTFAKLTGVYFLIISILFYFLWLSEIIPSTLKNIVPKTLSDTGLFTNPVHVIDLSVILPGIFITGILLLKKKSIGFFLAPIFLTFFIIMDLTIGGLMILMKQRGLEADLSVATIMGVLALVSFIFLAGFLSGRNFSLPGQFEN